MARQQGRHRFLGMMSVLVFLLLLANLTLPLLPIRWRWVLAPEERPRDEAQVGPATRRQFPQEWTQTDSGSALGGGFQNAATRSDAPGLPGSREEALSVTTEDLQLLEQRLAERFVTVERLEEELYRDALVRSASRKGGGGQAGHVTVVVPVPPSRPLPHPLPGRQF